VTVVVNRYVNDQKELLGQTENMLDIRVAGLIPNDYETAREAIDHGKPLTMIASRTLIGQWYLGGADHLIAASEHAKTRGAGNLASKVASIFGRCLSSLKIETRAKQPIL
jgi:Flp pilus assembly CpaE family ATPase